jgi:hypothetical protein
VGGRTIKKRTTAEQKSTWKPRAGVNVQKKMEKTENVTLYKGFEKKEDGTLWCRDYCFGQESEIVGKTFTLNNKEPLVMCKNGFHACDGLGKTLEFYPKDGKNVFYIIRAKEAYYEDAKKMVFRTFNVIKEAGLDVLDGNYNTGDGNTGYGNTGSRNTGDGNTGYGNTGGGNTGSRNTGDCNTGSRNTGSRNTGDGNTGYGNTGGGNTGDYNTGDCNTGNYNTGDGNTGYYNTGSRNTGSRNTGDGNTGSRNLCNNSAGFFAIEEPKADCFGLPTKFTISEFRDRFTDIIYTTPSFDNLMKLPNASKELAEAYMEKFNRLKKQ